MVTFSEGEKLGRSWSVEGKRVGKWTLGTDGKATVRSLSLVPFSSPNVRADVLSSKTTAVTACGNFGLVGSEAGDVVMFNLQSGMKRKVFKVPSAGGNDSRGRNVTGIATDSLNRVVVVSTLKGEVRVSRTYLQ